MTTTGDDRAGADWTLEDDEVSTNWMTEWWEMAKP